jgi:hypothetical protein
MSSRAAGFEIGRGFFERGRARGGKGRGRWQLGMLAVLVVCAPLLAGTPATAKPKLSDTKLNSVKINPRLDAQLASSGASESVPVSIWLNVPDPPVQRSRATSGSASSEAALDSHLDKVKDYMAPKRQGVVGALAQMGVQAAVPVYAPAVFADLNRGQVQKLARRSDVAALYGPEQTGLSADDAVTTERGWLPWNLGTFGQSDSQIRPVVHEEDGINDGNPFVNNATHGVYFWCGAVATYCPQGKNLADHGTIVAGEIAATHSLFRGVAPSVSAILSANAGNTDNDTQNVQAFEWAVGNGGDPINMSWGTFCGGFQTFFSRYIDWAIRNLYTTVVVAAGNHPTPCGNATNDEKVSSPALAWGAIAVGNHEDDDNGFWAGDSMNTSSDWVNPDFATGMEKPEVAAVGTNITSTDGQGGDWLGTGWTGTSMAAPQVAGQVALMFARRPGQRLQWPETNKAAVLTSAFHDIEVGDRSRDGVGSVAINHSDDTYRLGRYVNDCNASCFALQTSDFPRSYSINLTAGRVYRVAIAWDANSTGGAGSDTLGADIDLRVRRPDTTVIASSSSAQNAWEIVEFTANVTGTYTVEAFLFSSESGWPGTFLGMAYSERALAGPCTSNTTILPATGGTRLVNTANAPTFFDSYAGWGFDQSGRERLLKITLPATKDITVSDTNSFLDLHVLQIGNCLNNPVVPAVKGNGANSVFVDNAPAGTYYIAVDGRSGAVSSSNVTVGVSGP